jgi:cytochrome P450
LSEDATYPLERDRIIRLLAKADGQTWWEDLVGKHHPLAENMYGRMANTLLGAGVRDVTAHMVPVSLWRVIADDGSVWCETSDEQEARRTMRPGDNLMRWWVAEFDEWREEEVDSENTPRTYYRINAGLWFPSPEEALADMLAYLGGLDNAYRMVDLGDAMTVVMETFMARLDGAVPLPDTWPTPTNWRARKAVRRLEAIINEVIDSSRRSNSRAHLLGLLLQVEDDGDRLADREVRDEVMAFFLAGHETTALWLTGTFSLLASHPEVADRVEAELDHVLGDRPPTTDDVPRLGYTGQVLKESLRLYPPAYAFAREAVADTDAGGSRIPAKSTVILSPWVVHRDPRFWDRPETFDPDRWAPDPLKDLPRFAYFPFGGGPHLCIGAGFATVEATLLLAAIARRFRLELDPRAVVEPLPQITLRPRHGLPMTVRERTRARTRPVTVAGRLAATQEPR